MFSAEDIAAIKAAEMACLEAQELVWQAETKVHNLVIQPIARYLSKVEWTYDHYYSSAYYERYNGHLDVNAQIFGRYLQDLLENVEFDAGWFVIDALEYTLHFGPDKCISITVTKDKLTEDEGPLNFHDFPGKSLFLQGLAVAKEFA